MTRSGLFKLFRQPVDLALKAIACVKHLLKPVIRDTVARVRVVFISGAVILRVRIACISLFFRI